MTRSQLLIVGACVSCLVLLHVVAPDGWSCGEAPQPDEPRDRFLRFALAIHVGLLAVLVAVFWRLSIVRDRRRDAYSLSRWVVAAVAFVLVVLPLGTYFDDPILAAAGGAIVLAFFFSAVLLVPATIAIVVLFVREGLRVGDAGPPSRASLVLTGSLALYAVPASLLGLDLSTGGPIIC